MTDEPRETHSWPVGTVVAGRYRVDAVHEGGGMAVVHRVRHLDWGVDLAVKSPRPEVLTTDAHRQVFVREAETWVSLALHPHVCTCHYVTVVDGLPRAFAEYLPGGSLQDWIAAGGLYHGGPTAALSRVLDVAIQAAWGLRHAHEHAIVHQDVKAANVLLATGDPEIAVSAKVTDFGLAKARPAEPEVLRAQAAGGTVLTPRGGMTPTHASPEQFGDGLLTRRTDVWSFAVTVLEMLAGGVRWPVGIAAPAVLADLVDRGPDSRLPAVPEALADLLARCLRIDPDERPRTMAAVAAELTALKETVDHRPARRAPRSLAGGPVELNNRALSLIDLGQSTAALDTFDAALRVDPRHLESTYNAGLLRWRRGELSDDRLVAALQDARADHDDPPLARYLLAEVHRERGDQEGAWEAARTLRETEPDVPNLARLPEPLRRSPVRPVATLAEVEVPWQVHLHPGLPWQSRIDRAVSVRLSGDGRIALTGDYGGLVARWDLTSGERTAALMGHDGRVLDVGLSVDGAQAVSAGSDNSVRWWDLDAGCCLASWDVPPTHRYGLAVARIRLLPDGYTAALMRVGQGLQLFDLRAGEVLWTLPRTADDDCFELAASGRYLISSARDSQPPGGVDARVWDVQDGRCLRMFTGHRRPVTALLLREDHGDAFTGDWDGVLLHWELDTGKLVRELSGHTGPVRALVSTADGAHLVSGGDTTARLWDVASGRCLRTYTGRGGEVSDVQVRRDGLGSVVVAQQDNVVQRWPLPIPHAAPWQLCRVRSVDEVDQAATRAADLAQQAAEAADHGDVAAAVDLLSRARATPGHERETGLRAAWRRLARVAERPGLRSAWPRYVLSGHTAYVRDVALSLDARIGISAGTDGVLRVWDIEAGQCLYTLDGHGRPVTAVSLSQDGRTAVSANDDGELRLWDVETGACRRVMRSDTFNPVTRVRLLPFSGPPQALVAYSGAEVRLWDLADDTLHGDTSLVDGVLNDMVTSPAGDLMLLAADRTLHVYDLLDGRWRHALQNAPPSGFRLAALSPDGRTAVAAGDHRHPALTVWDVVDGRHVRTVELDASPNALQFTPDGRFVVTGGPRRRLQVWDVAGGACIRTVTTRGFPSTLAVAGDGFVVLVGTFQADLEVMEFDWDLAVASPPIEPHGR